MNDYTAKQNRRKNAYLRLAQSAKSASDRAHDASRAAVEHIPMGQPILVGHHSERRHRSALDRSDAAMRRSIGEAQKAEHYQRKADGVGKGGISSDDPEAIQKLTDQLERLREAHARMVEANKIIRRLAGDEDAQIDGLLALGWMTNDQAKECVRPDYAGRVGFPAYALSNSSANIRRIEGRIRDLGTRAERPHATIEGEGYVYREDPIEGRVMFIFAGKPDEATRKQLKANGFKWSPSRDGKPWVRHLNNAGIFAGRSVMEWLNSNAS